MIELSIKRLTIGGRFSRLFVALLPTIRVTAFAHGRAGGWLGFLRAKVISSGLRTGRVPKTDRVLFGSAAFTRADFPYPGLTLLATVGYGDGVVVKGPGRILCVLESVFGGVDLAVIVSAVVPGRNDRKQA